METRCDTNWILFSKSSRINISGRLHVKIENRQFKMSARCSYTGDGNEIIQKILNVRTHFSSKTCNRVHNIQ